MKKKIISILLPSLGGGGAERANLVLAREFSRRGFYVEFVLMQVSGELLSEAKTEFSIIDLKCKRLRNLPKILINYISNHKPEALIASMWPLTVIAPLSQIFSKHKCKILVCEQNYLSVQYKDKDWLNRILMRASMALGYRLAYKRVGVSSGVIKDISKLSGLHLQNFELIHNPVPPYSKPSNSLTQYVEKLWSCPAGGRLINVGSFKEQKNHRLLLMAFAQIDIPNARLMLLGEGEGRESIILLAKKLGVFEKIIFAGFQNDPTPFYSSADLFILSSDYEGFGNVIVEALACGTPVVSTDCPSGPAEILKNGEYGRLVPVRDIKALVYAIRMQLETKVNKNSLIERAANFSPEISASKYLRLLNEAI